MAMQRSRWLIVALLILALFAALIVYANHHENPLPDGLQADKILIEKSKHQLTLLKNGAALKVYEVALANPVGNKVQEGDNRTPEGIYTNSLKRECIKAVVDVRITGQRLHLGPFIFLDDLTHFIR